MTKLKQWEKLEYFFPNYKLYYSGRSDRNGGGVMICFAGHYDFELNSAFTVNLAYVESVAVKKKE